MQPLSERLEEADGNVYQTTSIPCTNDIEGPACPSDAVAGDTVPLSATLITSNDASADEEKGTTVQPWRDAWLQTNDVNNKDNKSTVTNHSQFKMMLIVYPCCCNKPIHNILIQELIRGYILYILDLDNNTDQSGHFYD